VLDVSRETVERYCRCQCSTFQCINVLLCLDLKDECPLYTGGEIRGRHTTTTRAHEATDHGSAGRQTQVEGTEAVTSCFQRVVNRRRVLPRRDRVQDASALRRANRAQTSKRGLVLTAVCMKIAYRGGNREDEEVRGESSRR